MIDRPQRAARGDVRVFRTVGVECGCCLPRRRPQVGASGPGLRATPFRIDCVILAMAFGTSAFVLARSS